MIEPMVHTQDSRLEFSERLKQALRHAGKAGRGQGAWLRKITDLSPKAASKWLNGESRPGYDTVGVIATALGVRAEWLYFGKGPMLPSEQQEQPAEYQVNGPAIPSADDYAVIPQLSARAANGNGYLNDHVEVTGGLAFKRAWLHKRHLKAENLSVIYAEGDSMEPNIVDGDVVVIDHSCTEPHNGNVYALRRPDGSISIKRLLQRVTGEWVITSDNPNKIRFPDEPLSAESVCQVPIIGEVVWRGGALM